ncbi:uncharacterized protein LOC144442804 [Glandiceps talaboti]
MSAKYKDVLRAIEKQGTRCLPMHYVIKNIVMPGVFGNDVDLIIDDDDGENCVAISKVPTLAPTHVGQQTISVCSAAYGEPVNEISRVAKLKTVLNGCESLWNDPQVMFDCSRYEFEAIEEVALSRSYRLKEKAVFYPMYKLTEMDVFNSEIEIAGPLLPGFEIRPLTPEHASFVASKWEYSSPLTGSVFSKFLNHPDIFLTSAVYRNSEKQPVSWAMILRYGDIGMEYTLPAYRRNGFMKAVICNLVKKITDKCEIPYVYISDSNHLSRKLHIKLGFCQVADGERTWVEFYKS